MRDSGISLKEYEEGLSSSPHFPQYVFELRGELVNGAEGKIMANHIRTMLMKMSVDDDEKKLIFKRIMIYYLFEEVLLSEANSNRVPRAKIWQFAEDLEKVETVNWPKAIEQHLRGALAGCKKWENNGCVGEHSFEGSMAVLEIDD
nr:protein root hair defective 3 [Tanacetum cinerariifolium]